MIGAMKRSVAVGAVVALAAALAACGSSSSTSTAPVGAVAGSSGSTSAAASTSKAVTSGGGSASSASTGPAVTIEFWGWSQGQKTQVQLFNKSHTDIQIKYVQQASAVTTTAALQNAIKAGGETACLVQSPSQLASALVDGQIQPIGKWMAAQKNLFNENAYGAASIGDEVYGIPYGANPTFMLVDKVAYESAGVAIPTTWEGLTAAGIKLKAKGINVINLAGEDPSTLENMAWQAGAKWYSINGDAWKVDFTSPESEKAAGVIQQWIDNDLVSHESYAQWDALMQKFDSGTMVSIPTSTWQLAAYAQNFKKSLGNWEALPLPAFQGDKPATPGNYLFTVVPKTCEHAAQAVEAGAWLATNDASLKALANTKTGSGVYPTVADPSTYIAGLMDTTMLGKNASTAVQVVKDGDAATVKGWQYGPDETTMYAELVDQWAKALDKKTTMKQVLQHMQGFVVADLTKRGINVS